MRGILFFARALVWRKQDRPFYESKGPAPQVPDLSGKNGAGAHQNGRAKVPLSRDLFEIRKKFGLRWIFALPGDRFLNIAGAVASLTEGEPGVLS